MPVKLNAPGNELINRTPFEAADGEMTFSGRDAAEAQTALRQVLGLKPEKFPVSAFVGMISDEIEQLRVRGHDDAAIARLVAGVTGKPVVADMITRFYATPEQRRGE